ncbi:MAG: ATPase RavA [bacterium ADurb.Bin425]|nr:MAG: ATPase RavA [bacterium ADurb.Bin425]
MTQVNLSKTVGVEDQTVGTPDPASTGSAVTANPEPAVPPPENPPLLLPAPVYPGGLDPAKLALFSEQMKQLEAELKNIFPEREHLVSQLVFALLSREHVLVHGVFGTGKSDLLSALYSCFETPTVFSIALNKFMSESHVIGVPNPKQMREEGVLNYQREGGILDAHLVELDEVLDANAPLLRVLLGILNERTFKRGRQIEKALLHTAVASTNGDPVAVVKSAPELGAVIDRFIFIAKVNYLESAESRRRMYAKFVSDQRPSVRISFDDLVAVSNLVCGTEIALDAEFLAVYDEVIQAYRKAYEKDQTVKISDRRACKLIKLVRASAAINGRSEVSFEDLYAVRWGLCVGNDRSQHETFMKVAKPIVDKAIEQKKQSFDEVCVQLLKKYESEIPTLDDKTPLSNDELVQLIRQVGALDKQIRDVKPQLPSNLDYQKKMRERLSALSAKLNDRLLPVK